MRIKMLGRPVDFIIVGKEADNLSPNARGRAFKYDRKIVVLENNITFNTILHEIKHLYMFLVGNDQITEYNKELDCDIFASCIEQLMIENGDDIFLKLKEFSKGEV